MKYRTLGRTGKTVSVVGVGTWQFGGEWGRQYTQAEVDAVLDQAADCGITLIDTAECYGDHVSERLIGDYLSRRNRTHWFVATKFGHRFHGFMDRTWHLSPADVEQQLERSLRALRVDAIDLYQFHSGSDEAFQNAELWAMLDRHKAGGRIRYLGVSISSKAGSLQARQASQVGADVLQILYNRLDRRAEEDFFPYALQDRLGVLARVPLASGFLTGKYDGDATFPTNDMRSSFDAVQVGRWLDEVARIRQRELPAGVAMAPWALAWCLKHPAVSSVIPGCKDAAQVKLNAAAVDLALE